MKAQIKERFAMRAILATVAGCLSMGSAPAFADLLKLKMANDGTLVIPLADNLGYFAKEGLEVSVVKAEDYTPSKDDYDSQIPLNKGQLDADLNWFHHVLFGAGNNAPVKAVILLENAPGMRVMVANRDKDTIKSAADFEGKTIATGALFSTKTYLTQYMMLRAGVPAHKYTSIGVETAGRFEAIVKGLKDETLDVMTFNEPLQSRILDTGMVTTLYDLTNKEGTVKAFGDYWPAQCVFVAPSFIQQHPDTVQHLVNAFVRAMRFVNTHSAEQIAAALPCNYFEGKDKAAAIRGIELTLPQFAMGDYSFSPSAVKMVADAVFGADFDDSGEGKWRQRAKTGKLNLDQTYDNRFVERAMAEIK
jgi:NitT/TauT family transport system substrate-binding protein